MMLGILLGVFMYLAVLFVLCWKWSELLSRPGPDDEEEDGF